LSKQDKEYKKFPNIIQDEEKFYMIPSIMAALLNRISSKVHLIYSQFDLI